MRSLLVGLWKEMRDQRAVLIAVLVSLPVLVLGAAWAFGDHVPEQHFAPTALFVVPASLALFLFAVASEIFGSERRRGTLDFTRRLPNGLWRSFGAKLVAYVVGSALFLAWGWIVAWSACRAFAGPVIAEQFVQYSLIHVDPVPTMLVAGLLCFGVWVLVASTWIPQGGAAVLGAGLLLGLIALPAYLRLKDSEWLMNHVLPREKGGMLALLGTLSAAAVVALGVSHLRGNRRLASAWSPAWRGLALLLVMAGVAYAAGARTLDRITTLDPRDEDFRIQSGSVGVGGRYAYLNVLRAGGAWEYGGQFTTTTPIQPWLVDLETGSYQQAGEFCDAWSVDPIAPHAPQPFVLMHLSSGNGGVGWYDGATGELRTTLPYGVRTRAMAAWEREGLAALAWHRDAEGRALWFEGDRLVREGDPLPSALQYRVLSEYCYPIPGGWCRYKRRQVQGQASFETIEAATGRVRSSSLDFRRGSPLQYLSPSLILLQVKADPKARAFDTLAVVDLDAPDDAPRVVQAPADFAEILDSGLAHMVGRGDGGPYLYLMAAANPDERRLLRWEPLTGVARELTSNDGPIRGVRCSAIARVPKNRAVLRVDLPATLEGHKDYRFAYYVVDSATLQARALAAEGSLSQVVTILPDGAVVGIEDASRLVRYGPEAGARTVLFPR